MFSTACVANRHHEHKAQYRGFEAVSQHDDQIHEDAFAEEDQFTHFAQSQPQPQPQHAPSSPARTLSAAAPAARPLSQRGLEPLDDDEPLAIV